MIQIWNFQKYYLVISLTLVPFSMVSAQDRNSSTPPKRLNTGRILVVGQGQVVLEPQSRGRSQSSSGTDILSPGTRLEIIPGTQYSISKTGAPPQIRVPVQVIGDGWHSGKIGWITLNSQNPQSSQSRLNYRNQSQASRRVNTLPGAKASPSRHQNPPPRQQTTQDQRSTGVVFEGTVREVSPTSSDTGSLMPPEVSYLQSQEEWAGGINPGVLGTKKVMATLFQSCAPLTTRISSSVKGPNPFLAIRSDAASNRQCRATASPQYGWGSKAKFNSDSVDFFSKNRKPSLDCSGFVNAAWAAGGLRLQPGNDSPTQYTLNTLGFLGAVNPNRKNNKNTCIAAPHFNPSESLKAGDLIVQGNDNKSRARHMVMVKSVGPDPFGLNSITERGQCHSKNLRVERFDFEIAQSSSRIGPATWDARSYLPRSGTQFKSAVIALAVKACEAKFRSHAGVGQNSNSFARRNPAAGIRAFEPHYAIVRHSGSPECLNPNPPRIKGEECINSCLAQHIAKTSTSSQPAGDQYAVR